MNKKTLDLVNSITTHDVLDKMCEAFYAIYLIDIENKTALKIEYAVDHFKTIEAFSLSAFEKEIIKNVDREYHNTIIDILNTSNLKASFKKPTDFKEAFFKVDFIKWTKMTLRPLNIFDEVPSLVLLTLTDVTEIWFKYQHSLSNIVLEKANKYEKLVYSVFSDTYVAIFEVNLTSKVVLQLYLDEQGVKEKYNSENSDNLYAKIIKSIHPDDRANVMMLTHPKALMDASDSSKISCNFRMQRVDGVYRWYSATINCFIEKDGSHKAIIFCKDINEEMMELSHLKEISERDELTYLYNRNKLDNMIESEYELQESCGVLFFDVNYLKETNDSSGHTAGDALLTLASSSIRSITNRTIHGYRYGGDEFVVIICNCKPTDLKKLIDLWELRLDTISKNSELKLTMAVGSAWAKKPFSVMELIKEADLDMYACKKRMKKGEIE